MIKNNPNTGKFWDRLIETDQKVLIKSPIYLEKNKIVLKYLKKIKGKILDIGVGYGHLEKEILSQKIRLSMYGIDIASQSISRLQHIYGKNFKKGKITKIPFKDNYFDCALALDILEHIEKNKIMLSLHEVYRVVKTDGYVIISVPMNDTPEDTARNGHLRKYTDKVISDEITKSGFRILNKTILYAFKNLFYIKNLLIKIIPFVEKRPNLIIILAQKI